MSSISGIGSSMSMMMQGMHGARQRPDPSQMAEDLFSKLDTSGQGYIQKSDLETAFSKISSSSSSDSATSSTASADDLFSTLDANGDGKVTKDEFTNGLKKVAEQLDNQFMSMRLRGGMQGAGGMPPPPPQDGADDAGFTKDELTSQLNSAGSSDSKMSSLISNIVSNFDKADTDGDGKVSFKEAMAYDQGASGSASGSSSTSSSSDTAATASDTNAKLMLQIMQLMQTYGIGPNAQSSSSLSVTA